MIDTIVLAGNCDGALHNILPGTTGHKASILPGPEDPAAAEEQWTFVRTRTLAMHCSSSGSSSSIVQFLEPHAFQTVLPVCRLNPRCRHQQQII